MTGVDAMTTISDSIGRLKRTYLNEILERAAIRNRARADPLGHEADGRCGTAHGTSPEAAPSVPTQGHLSYGRSEEPMPLFDPPLLRQLLLRQKARRAPRNFAELEGRIRQT